MSAEVESIFKEFESLRPENVSFSLFIAQAVTEFVKSKRKNDTIIQDETVPLFFSNIQQWIETVPKLEANDFKKLQQRHAQIGNIINKEVNKRL